MFIISVCLHSNCICALGYVFLGSCHTLERKTTFEQIQGIHKPREAFTKSLNILLFYPNCDQEILEGEMFLLLALQYIITLLITVLRLLATTYVMKIDEETIDEKATSMSSVMSSLLIFPLLMHLFMYV